MANVNKIKIPEMKKQLKEFSQKELIGLVSDIYKLNQDVQHYLSVKFLGEETIIGLFENAMREIKYEFFPDKGFGKMRLAKARGAITNFKKLTNDHHRTIELMVFYVETGTKFTTTYGDIDERFYDSMCSMYNKVVTECEKDKKLFYDFNDRLYAIVVETEGMGWGYHDELSYMYHSISWLDE
ncbi:DUF6155 family protein [Virgibacillus necropolis]|uniref:DUF6155 family protein n=1 Tax=Virgibacillus necropolis TaxID=163877 RepID=UPI00384FA410